MSSAKVDYVVSVKSVVFARNEDQPSASHYVSICTHKFLVRHVCVNAWADVIGSAVIDRKTEPSPCIAMCTQELVCTNTII